MSEEELPTIGKASIWSEHGLIETFHHADQFVLVEGSQEFNRETAGELETYELVRRQDVIKRDEKIGERLREIARTIKNPDKSNSLAVHEIRSVASQDMEYKHWKDDPMENRKSYDQSKSAEEDTE